MFKKLVLILLLIPVFLFAQSSGKVAGVVVDKSTGDPLPGVNVIVEGTTLGSSTDIDGYFVILNMPVGVYDIRANYIGYKDVVVQNVRVSANITTEVNFELEPTTLELEEAIVVTAERPLVEKNVTSSISLVTAKDIEAVPVRGLTNLAALQASVVVQDGNFHIRGSRSDEVGFYLDGANVNNPLNNAPAVVVIQEAIEEFQVFAGGYTADLGGANGGIIRAELKTGGPRYNVSVDFQTDKFANQGEKFLGTYSYGHHIGVVTVGGPLVSNKVRFFVAAQNHYQADRQVRFSKGFDFANRVDENPRTPEAERDTIPNLHYPDGFTPNNKLNQYALNGTLLFDMTNFKLRIGGAYSTERTYLDDAPMLNVLNTRQQYDDEKSLLLTGRFTHVISPKTYYDLNLSYFNRSLERGDDWFENDWLKWQDSLANAQYSRDRFGPENEVVFRDRWHAKYEYQLNGFFFNRFGTPNNYSAYYRISKQNYIGGALDFVSQVTRNHEVKLGFDARYYTVRYFAIQSDAVAIFGDSLSTIQDVIDNNLVSEWVETGFVDNYGYDYFGNEIDSGIDGPKHPLFMAFYLQDKIEYNDLIVNLGVRFDYFDTDDRKLKNPGDPDFEGGFIAEDAWEDVDPFQQVSPRIGFSFPVSERTVFYMQYGKFIQMSELNNIYFGSARYTRQMNPKFYYINPIGFGLEPVRTTSYEVGFRQQLSSVAAFDITGFYKNVKGQIQIERFRADPGARYIQTYERLVNGDFATTKGLEFRFTLRRAHRIQAQVNYTLTNAEGTGSTEGSYHAAIYRNTQKPTVISPLDYSQTHTGSIVLDYRFGKNDGGPILQRLGLNTIFTFSSGHPFTFVFVPPGGQVGAYEAGVDYMLDTRSRQALEPIGSSVTPWTFNVDLRIDKTFTLMNNLDVNVYARITNLLNTRNVLNVYERTGNAYDDGFLSDPVYSETTINTYGGQDYIEMYRRINLENGQAYWDIVGRQLWGHPRQIFFGIKLVY
ncbi:MAG: hypothetical protein Kow0042_10660 [Calditrichia bacterium]